jgi:hypothetical protein
VQQRTADLVRANAALKAEMAEREAAENERKRTERALGDFLSPAINPTQFCVIYFYLPEIPFNLGGQRRLDDFRAR